MDKNFERNSLKPGDAGFEYDKVVDFTNSKKEKNSWDGSDNEEYEEDEYSNDWDE